MYKENSMSRLDKNRPQLFVCQHCKRTVPIDAYGTQHRNHCPWCLWSRHVDNRIGDRKSACYGNMEPIAVWAKENGEWSIVHRCQSCATLRLNRIAGDDNDAMLLSLAIRPLARPPFPLEYVARQY